MSVAHLASVVCPTTVAVTERESGQQLVETVVPGPMLAVPDAPVDPVSPLEPRPGVLSPGTTSIELQLTTLVAADCRWSDEPDTAYADMPHAFTADAAGTGHRAVVDGWEDGDERRFYARCADRVLPPGMNAPPRDPDSFEVDTHLRVLAPIERRSPRIANVWGVYDARLGPEFYSGYELFLPWKWGFDGEPPEAAEIRARNPSIRILLTQNATAGTPEKDALVAEWYEADPDDPDYNCLLRDTEGEIELIDRFQHPLFNMTQPNCVTLVAHRSVESYRSAQPDLGYDLAYDGLYWDRLHAVVSSNPDLDSDQDGTADDPAVLDATYQMGLIDFLQRVRDELPEATLMGNGAANDYAPWLDGNNVEWQLVSIQDGTEDFTFTMVFQQYLGWTERVPMALIMSSPEQIYTAKFAPEDVEDIPASMFAEASTSYARMRFGLGIALMGDGMYAFDWGAETHGQPWWYDEFGDPADVDPASTSVPDPGYLGLATEPAGLLVERLDTPSLLTNGGFRDGMHGWTFWVEEAIGTEASASWEAGAGPDGSAAVRFDVAAEGQAEFRQVDRSVEAGVTYTASFWARASVPQAITVQVKRQTAPWETLGFHAGGIVTSEWQHFHLVDTVEQSVDDAKIMVVVADEVGALWIDDVQFQEGALGVWAREYEGGLAAVNTTPLDQRVFLPGAYRKLDGPQAPLFQVRIDDDEATLSPGWTEREATYDEFGLTVHTAPGQPLVESPPTATYVPDLRHAGDYEVLTWVVPRGGQSPGVTIDVHHADGIATVELDSASGAEGMRSLGTWRFDAGEIGKAVLHATGTGEVVADAFKWVSADRYNDGSVVSELDLAANDAIILLQCDVGACAAGQVPNGTQAGRSPLEVSRQSDDVELTWSTTCGRAERYAVYEGSLESLRRGEYDHQGRDCDAGSDGALETTLRPTYEASYFLVVPAAEDVEGLYGADSYGQQRPRAAAACTELQDTRTCP